MLKKIGIISSIIAVVLLGAIFYNHYFHKKIQSKPQAYCYQTYFGTPNPCLMISDLAYSDSLISYYNKMEQGENPIFNFPLQEVTFGSPVYVLGYEQDSMLVEILSYRKGDFKGSTYDKGFVYYKTIHDDPPMK
ncbi:MAG: hypothetical protein M3Q58_11420 [Bacteroidota bacterium]|nr:hypothetical protein [Bacteroidota bacterium]